MLKTIITFGIIILGIIICFAVINIKKKNIRDRIKFIAFPMSMYLLGWFHNSNNSSHILYYIAVCIVPIAAYISATLVKDKIK